MDKKLEDMTHAELKAELERIRENLRDLEDMHAFTFGKTSVHIGAEKAQNLQTEYEEERRIHNDRIVELEAALKERGIHSGS